MNKYGQHGKLKAIDGKGDELVSILLKASKIVSEAKGCDLYIVSKDKNDNNLVWVTEVWESKEDHDNSLNLEEVRRLISQAIPILDGPPERGQELEIIGGLGIDN